MEEQRRKAKFLRMALGMMGIQTDNPTAHKIYLAVREINEKKSDMTIKDACVIEAVVLEIYKTEEDGKAD